MRRLRVTLTDDQYEFVKEQGPLFLRDVVQIIMEHPGLLLEKKKWWRW